MDKNLFSEDDHGENKFLGINSHANRQTAERNKKIGNTLSELMCLKQEKKFERVPGDNFRVYIDTKDFQNNVRNSINPDDEFANQKLFENLKIKGTCQEQEKPYFRQTEIPDPVTVRPEEVLKKALKNIEARYRNKEVEFLWVLDQLNSIRQDMKIQIIVNEFTIEVYEKNARLCLEAGDLQQYKICQGQLIDLYREGFPGNKHEFYLYKIVYLTQNSEKFELNRFLKEMSPEDLKNEYVQIGIE